MISNVYNYYLSTYGNKPYSKHSAHKKDELRDVYNNIVKRNRANPFFDVDISEESQKYAIDIKENARSLLDITGDLTDASSGAMTFKSIAESDQPDTVAVDYIGDNTSVGEGKKFKIGVKQLATPQVNTGNFLNPKARGLFTGTYSFDVNISSITYEMQFGVKDSENNLDVQNKLARLINNSNIGLNAQVISNNDGKTALEITSNMTGVGDKPAIFTISDEDSSALSGAVDVLGLNQTSHYPSNAVFELNGETRISSSNIFTVDRAFEITLKKVSEDISNPATIGLKQNLDALVDSVNELANSYNSLVDLAKRGNGTGSKHLAADLAYIADNHRNALEANGLMVNQETGMIEVDGERLRASAKEGSLIHTLSDLNQFKSDLQDKAEEIMLDPMEYINKVMISYKNPQRPSGDTYTSSIYSGMLYNGYC